MSVPVKTKLRSAAVTLLFLSLQNRLVPKLLPFKGPPVLILSYPRSGSSWVGKILATSPGAAYLREPITQQYMFIQGGKFALADVDNDPSAFSIYRQLSDPAFQGIPPRHAQTVHNLQDFFYSQRTKKRLIIKEVNPRATRFYCERYKPKVLLLLRHPAAVALSFYQLGWIDSPDVQIDTGNPTDNEWRRFGYTYGTLMHNSIETLKEYGNHEIVIYRNLAADPQNGFRKLFNALDLEVPANYDDVIRKYCYSSKTIQERGEVERTSSNMIFKWRNELSQQQVSDLQSGFMRSKLEYYRDEHEWAPVDAGANS
ncbi:MAG: sulfotransferase domain-containing protein [Chloroflexota bacterium]